MSQGRREAGPSPSLAATSFRATIGPGGPTNGPGGPSLTDLRQQIPGYCASEMPSPLNLKTAVTDSWLRHLALGPRHQCWGEREGPYDGEQDQAPALNRLQLLRD